MRPGPLLLLSLLLALCACSTVVADSCTSFYSDSCASCSSAPASLNCGWCTDLPRGAQCVTGNTYGPSSGWCSTNSWGFQYRACKPVESKCIGYSSCTMCTTNNQASCGWCGDTQTCHSTSNSASCANRWAQSSGMCASEGPSNQPSSGVIGGGVAGTVISLLVAFTFLTLYSCSRWWQPTLGSRINAPGCGRADYSHWCQRLTALLIAFVSFVLSLTAMGVDAWSHASIHFIVTVEVLMGTLKARVHVSDLPPGVHMPPDMTSSMSYSKLCHNAAADGFGMGSCNQLRASGIMTLAFGILAVIVTLCMLVCALLVMFRRARMPAYAVRMWRLAGVAEMLALASVTSWLFGGHLAWRHQTADTVLDVKLGASWGCMLVSLFFDFLLVIYWRFAILYTPAEGQEAMNDAAAAAAAAAALASVPYAQPVFSGVGYPVVSATPYAPPSVLPQQHGPYAAVPQQPGGMEMVVATGEPMSGGGAGYAAAPPPSFNPQAYGRIQ